MSFKVAYLGSKKANNGFMCNFNNFDKKKVFPNMKRNFPQDDSFWRYVISKKAQNVKTCGHCLIKWPI